MIRWFLRRGQHRYSHLKNVRVHRTTMVVERLFVTKIRRRSNGSAVILEKKWKVVDCHTTYECDDPQPCTEQRLELLLQTAF